MKSFHTEHYRFINYRDISDQETRDILDIRNDESVRKQMVNEDIISLNGHLDFIRSLTYDASRDYFLIKDFYGNLIGSVNLHYEESYKAERGIFISPLHQNQGHATRSLREFYNAIRKEGVKVITTKVKEGNAPSNSLEKRLGAVLISSRDGYNHYNLPLQKIVIRADAGNRIGYGHFIRSIALADYLKDVFNCEFFSYNPCGINDFQVAQIAGICHYNEIKAGSLEEYNRKFLDSLTGDEIVVLDNYYFNSEYHHAIREKGCKLVCIDDIHNRKMECDALISGMPLKREDFDIPSHSLFLGGLQHSFLRTPFLVESHKEKKLSDIVRIVLAIGGADPFDLTSKLTGVILSVLQNCKLTVITPKPEKIPMDLRGKIIVKTDLTAQEMTDVFHLSDLGVFPASTVSIEALACRLPIAAGWFVDNQLDLYNYGIHNDLFLPLGNFFDDTSQLKDRFKVAIENISTLKTGAINFIKGKSDIINLFLNEL